ncbi:MAG: hypothetical protein QNJ12_06535 [Ilumatobacter sp.]|uniref:hypothetical protein n=1 Tax=Ilumatobacter sp. TaxID=1967498 RepID=UPI00260EBE51|nr:hypothetical protein [Ilumatobacter sp.]MDJ0768431.1 hypothetical protein [Ilumatobacter sp.]
MFHEFAQRVAGACDDGLDARLRRVEQQQRDLAAEEAPLLHEIDRRTMHRSDGHASMSDELRAEPGWSDGECRHRMRSSGDSPTSANSLKQQGDTVHRDALGHWHTYRADGSEIC